MLLGLGNILNGPFRHSGHSTLLLIRFIDMAMLFGAVWMIYFLWHAQIVFDEYCRIVIGLLAAMIFARISQIYRHQRNMAGCGKITRVLSARGFGFFSIIAMGASIRLELWFSNSYSWIATWGGLALLIVLTTRSIYQYFLHWLKSRGPVTSDGTRLRGIERIVVQTAETSGSKVASDRSLPRLAVISSEYLKNNHANDAIWPTFADRALHRAFFADRGAALRTLINRYVGHRCMVATNLCTVVSFPKAGVKVFPMDKYSRLSQIVRLRNWGLRSIEDNSYFESA